MKKLINSAVAWYLRPAPIWSLIWFAPIVIFISILSQIIVFYFFIKDPTVLPENRPPEEMCDSKIWIIAIYFICGFGEEFIFRLVPFIFFLYLCDEVELVKKYVNKKFLFILIVLISSIFFGLAHGNIYNILIQGIGGVIFFLVFIKYSGHPDEYDVPLSRGLLASSVVHIGFNMTSYSLT